MRLASGALALTACSGALPLGPTSGGVDRDGDGYSVEGGDCDDDDPAVHPGAIDWPGDGIDQDCSGEDAEALEARGLSPGDLVITEVLRDPVGVSPDLGEWFEITNRLDVAVDLAGALVTDGLTDDFVVSRPLVIAPGAAVVLGGWDDPAENGGVEVDFRYPPGFGIANTEGRIRLLVAETPIDEVGWDARWPRRDGSALSLGSGSLDAIANDDRGAWCLAGDDAVYGLGGRGTPGEPNPPCPPPFEGLTIADLAPGDLVISEVMQNPSAVDDDFGEWIEVYVATDGPIDLWRLVIENDDDDFEVEASLVVEPGSYVVFASFLDPEVNGGVPADVEWRWDLGLSNAGDTIRLLAGTAVIDEISYDNGATFPDPDGRSMSLDPSALNADDNDDGLRWCEGVTPYGDGDLGTPGAPNPPCG